VVQKQRFDNITLKRNIKMHVNAGTGRLTILSTADTKTFPRNMQSV